MAVHLCWCARWEEGSMEEKQLGKFGIGFYLAVLLRLTRENLSDTNFCILACALMHRCAFFFMLLTFFFGCRHASLLHNNLRLGFVITWYSPVALVSRSLNFVHVRLPLFVAKRWGENYVCSSIERRIRESIRTRIEWKNMKKIEQVAFLRVLKA